jgi:hypothetical protein
MRIAFSHAPGAAEQPLTPPTGRRQGRRRDPRRRRQGGRQLRLGREGRIHHQDGHRRLWAHRYPHQQCGHPARCQLQEHEAVGLGPHLQRPRQGRIQVRARSVAVLPQAEVWAAH